MCVLNRIAAEGAHMPATESPAPYATLLAFARYVGRNGPAKASFVGGLRRQRASQSGFNPHGSLIKALKADIQWRTPGIHLTRVVEEVKPRWRPLYRTLLPGALSYLDSLGDLGRVHLAQSRDALAVVGVLPVKVNPQIALRYDDGRAEAVRLYFDPEPPAADAVLATLHLMERNMDGVLPGAHPVVVDVRRGEVYRPDAGEPDAKRLDEVERWLAGEAAAFSAMWSVPA
jgi:hypothetical protein